jgi:GntR family transcriptional regulator
VLAVDGARRLHWPTTSATTDRPTVEDGVMASDAEAEEAAGAVATVLGQCIDNQVVTRISSQSIGADSHDEEDPRLVPRYLALTEALNIELLGLAPNTLLPTELQLARRFGVSRVTVRQALGVLERGGFVSRQRGRGTTVSPPKVVRSLTPVSNLEEDLARQGLRLHTELVRFEPRHSAPPEILALLDPDARADVGFVALLQSVNDRVIAYDRSYFPRAVAERLNPADLSHRPAFEIAREMVGSPNTSVEWEIEIGPAPSDVRGALGVTPGLPVVIATSTLRRDDGNLVIRMERFYRIDRVKFRQSSRYPAPPADPGAADPAVSH